MEVAVWVAESSSDAADRINWLVYQVGGRVVERTPEQMVVSVVRPDAASEAQVRVSLRWAGSATQLTFGASDATGESFVIFVLDHYGCDRDGVPKTRPESEPTPGPEDIARPDGAMAAGERIATCATCGHEASPSNSFCIVCGAQLEATARYAGGPTSSEVVAASSDAHAPMPATDRLDGRQNAGHFESSSCAPAEESTILAEPLTDEPDDVPWVEETILDEPEPYMTVWLRSKDGSAAHSMVFDSEGDSLVVGRDPIHCDLLLPEDLRISRRHIRVTAIGDSAILEDLGSSNGTYVNSMRVREPVSLADGDLIEFGRSAFEFHRV